MKKQEAMQRRERIQIEARNCSSNSSPNTHPTPSSLPTPLPQAMFSVRNAVLALDGKLVTESHGQRATEGGEIQQHEEKCISLGSAGLGGGGRGGSAVGIKRARLNPQESEVPGVPATSHYRRESKHTLSTPVRQKRQD